MATCVILPFILTLPLICTVRDSSSKQAYLLSEEQPTPAIASNPFCSGTVFQSLKFNSSLYYAFLASLCYPLLNIDYTISYFRDYS